MMESRESTDDSRCCRKATLCIIVCGILVVVILGFTFIAKFKLQSTSNAPLWQNQVIIQCPNGPFPELGLLASDLSETCVTRNPLPDSATWYINPWLWVLFGMLIPAGVMVMAACFNCFYCSTVSAASTAAAGLAASIPLYFVKPDTIHQPDAQFCFLFLPMAQYDLLQKLVTVCYTPSWMTVQAVNTTHAYFSIPIQAEATVLLQIGQLTLANSVTLCCSLCVGLIFLALWLRSPQSTSVLQSDEGV